MMCNLKLNMPVGKKEETARHRQSSSLGQELQVAYYSARKITHSCSCGMRMYGEMEIRFHALLTPLPPTIAVGEWPAPLSGRSTLGGSPFSR